VGAEILESELDKFRQPTPRLMDPHDRLILEATAATVESRF
jgi:hypothetical protein